MIIALVIAVASIVGGSALALVPSHRSQILGPVRTFGLTASVSVVLLHLLPEVYEARGAVSLLAFVLALMAPGAIRPVLKLVRAASGAENAEWVTLRITYVSLLVHSVADGIALAAYSGHMHHGTPHYDVLVALSAHTVPVVAVMILTFRDFRGLRFALFGALGLLIATSSGVVLAGLVPGEVVHGASAWVGALVAGLLLHVVTHDLGVHPPRHGTGRLVDLLAAAAGVGVGLLSGDAHSHLAEAQGMGPSLGHALWQISVQTAPVLLLGLLGGALLSTFESRFPSSWLGPRSHLKNAVQGAVVGIPLPRWSPRVLLLSKALHERRAGSALVVAFLLAMPVLGVETFALSVRFLGWDLAWLRLGSALLMAVVAGLVVGKLTPRPAPQLPPPAFELSTVDGSFPRRIVSAFDELLHHVGAWMVLGVVAAAFVEALVPAESMGLRDNPLAELAVVTLLTVPSHVCAPSAIPLAAVLIAKGVSPGAVLVGLLLGPATNLATLAFLRGAFGLRATLLCTLAIVAVSWSLAFATNQWLNAAALPKVAAASEHGHTWFGLAAAGLLSLLILRSVWRSGTRAWIAAMLHAGSSQHGAADGRDHAHGHAHGY